MEISEEEARDIRIRKVVNDGIVALNAGNAEDAASKIEEFLSIGSQETDILDAVRQMTITIRRPDLEIAVCRYAVNNGFRFTSYSTHLMEALRVSNRNAIVSDFIGDVPYLQLGRYYFVTGFRVAGVELVVQCLGRLLNVPRTELRLEAYENQQFLFAPKLIQWANEDQVSGHNLIATEPDIQLMQAFAIRPVVIRRNIFDALFGLARHMATMPGDYAGAFFGKDFKSFNLKHQIDAVTSKFGNAYIEQCVSWSRVASNNRLDTCEIDHEDLVKEPVATIQTILDFYAKDISDEEVASVVNAVIPGEVASNQMLGLGHGDQAFSDEQKALIHSYTQFYPDVDFRPYGLNVYPDSTGT